MRKVLYIFGSLTDDDVAWIAAHGVRRRLADGETVIAEGVESDSLVILLEGEFQVVAAGFGEVARAGVGEIVGEISLVDSAPPSATVTAKGECLTLFLDKRVLAQKLASDAAFGSRFYRALAVLLADRLRAARRLPSAHERGLGDDKTILQDELDAVILDASSSAGERFNRMLKMLMGM
jgi:CRP/FNR family transcriptional regulator, cyclic AMP receptor protein